MRNNVVKLEEERLKGFEDLSDYDQVHERHRIFPGIFGNKDHSRVIDLSAGMGVVVKNIRDAYDCEIIANDISPKCLSSLQELGFQTTSFNLDDPETPFPFLDDHFDAVITLATIEHLINIDYFLQEIHRVLKKNGHLYISAPNYAAPAYLYPLLVKGRTFHDPLDEKESYEFYAHVRYFTYRTLMEFVTQYDYTPETVYLPVPRSSSRYLRLKKKNPLLAALFKLGMTLVYKTVGPRWASEPVICFKKGKQNGNENNKWKKILL